MLDMGLWASDDRDRLVVTTQLLRTDARATDAMHFDGSGEDEDSGECNCNRVQKLERMVKIRRTSAVTRVRICRFAKVSGYRVQTSVCRSIRPEILRPVASTFCNRSQHQLSYTMSWTSVLPPLTRIGATAIAVRGFWCAASMLDIRYRCPNIASVASCRLKPTSRSNSLNVNFVLRRN